MTVTATVPGSAPVAAPVDLYSCALAPTVTGSGLQALAVVCPGRSALPLPGPYSDQQVNYPAGAFGVPGWRVDHLLCVGGEARVWLQDATQSCLLRLSMLGGGDGLTRVSCNVRSSPTQPGPPSRPHPTRTI